MTEATYKRTPEQEACGHRWHYSNLVRDTAPPIYTRSCGLCRLVQHRGGLPSVRGIDGWWDAGCCMDRTPDTGREEEGA